MKTSKSRKSDGVLPTSEDVMAELVKAMAMGGFSFQEGVRCAMSGPVVMFGEPVDGDMVLRAKYSLLLKEDGFVPCRLGITCAFLQHGPTVMFCGRDAHRSDVLDKVVDAFVEWRPWRTAAERIADRLAGVP